MISAATNVASLHLKCEKSLVRYLSMEIGGIAELSKTKAASLACSSPRRRLGRAVEPLFRHKVAFQEE